MRLTGPYKLEITGDIAALDDVGGNQDQIGYLMQRLLTGEKIAEVEMRYWGIAIAQVGDGYVTVPRYPDSIIPEPTEPTPEMIEAGWQVLDAEGIAAPEVETMTAMWAAMERAR